MRKPLMILFVLLAVASLAVWAQAAFNPSNTGLPRCNLTIGDGTSTDNTQYSISIGSGTDNVYCGVGSTICVKCHSRNPAARTTLGAANAGFRGTHFVTYNFNDTHRGGGYQGDGKNTRYTSQPDNAVYMADNTISGGTINWTAPPRYGLLTGSTLVNTSDPENTSYGTNRPQMICESCHSVIYNTGVSKTLARGYANDNAALCAGCHGDMDGILSNEWQYVSSNTSFLGTHHHRNNHSGDDYYGPAGVTRGFNGTGPYPDIGMHRMDRSLYRDAAGASQGYQMWAANYGSLSDTARDIDYTTSPRMRAATIDNQAAAGPPIIGVRPGQNAGGRAVICTNCHRGHNGDTSHGATILVRGSMASPRLGMLGDTTAAGMNRMFDVGGRANVYRNYNALCLTCHR